MIYISLASGSSGNCALIREGGTNILLDAGISARRIRLGLAEFGLGPSDLTAILITHEHSDHVSGLGALTKYADVPVYTGGGTARFLAGRNVCAGRRLRIVEAERALRLGAVELTAFETPHDAAESFGFVFACEGGSLAVATDLGCVTGSVERALLGCDAAVLEANHDVEMLRRGPYPQPLKRRILGNLGHLSNTACAELALRLAESGTKSILLAHLSHENNTPELAFGAVMSRLGAGVELNVAPRDKFSAALEL